MAQPIVRKKDTLQKGAQTYACASGSTPRDNLHHSRRVHRRSCTQTDGLCANTLLLSLQSGAMPLVPCLPIRQCLSQLSFLSFPLHKFRRKASHYNYAFISGLNGHSIWAKADAIGIRPSKTPVACVCILFLHHQSQRGISFDSVALRVMQCWRPGFMCGIKLT